MQSAEYEGEVLVSGLELQNHGAAFGNPGAAGKIRWAALKNYWVARTCGSEHKRHTEKIRGAAALTAPYFSHLPSRSATLTPSHTATQPPSDSHTPFVSITPQTKLPARRALPQHELFPVGAFDNDCPIV